MTDYTQVDVPLGIGPKGGEWCHEPLPSQPMVNCWREKGHRGPHETIVAWPPCPNCGGLDDHSENCSNMELTSAINNYIQWGNRDQDSGGEGESDPDSGGADITKPHGSPTVFARAGRAGVLARDEEWDSAHNHEEYEETEIRASEACARAVLETLGIKVDGWEYQLKYDSDSHKVRSNEVTGKEMQRRLRVEVEWQDVQ